MRSRQSSENNKETSSRQKQEKIIEDNNKIPGLNKIPVTSFEKDTTGQGLFKTGKLKPRVKLPIPFVENFNDKGRPVLKEVLKFSYFFVKFDSPNGIGVASTVKNFVVIRTLNPMSVVDFCHMSGYPSNDITTLTLSEYQNNSFTHPKYINSNGSPLSIRYAEIAILIQRTPGRIDDTPIGYPDFDSTPDRVTTRKGPLGAPPYTSFSSATGLTSSVTIVPGGTVPFKDTSPYLPFNAGPTGWSWNFGPSASPTGSTAQNPIVTYGTTGTYSVTLTASNAYGSTPFTRTNFIIVTY